jgi:hypothetical protein
MWSLQVERADTEAKLRTHYPEEGLGGGRKVSLAHTASHRFTQEPWTKSPICKPGLY